MKLAVILSAALLNPVMSISIGVAEEKVEPQTITFPAGQTTRPGYFYVPEGKGPFPVMVWVHANVKPLLEAGPTSEFAGIAKAYLSDNYIVFLPDRHRNAVNLSEFSPDTQKRIKERPKDSGTELERYLEVLELNAQDVM